MCIFKQLIKKMRTTFKKQTDHSIHVVGLAEDWQLSPGDTLDAIRMLIDG